MTDGPTAQTGFAYRAASGVLWGTAQRWASKTFGFVTIAVLARLLSPADFGVVAVALAILPFVYLLSDFGFSTYLVQAENPTDRTYSTAFWYSSTAGIVLGTALWASAPLVERTLGTDGVAAVVSGMAPAVVVVSLGAVPLAILRRQMRFRTVALQDLVAGVSGQAIAIAMALAGFGVWALVVQTVLTQVVVTVLSAITARWRPSLLFSRADFVAMLRFGTATVGIEAVSLTKLWAENGIVAMSLGLTGLGYLNIAQRLIQVAQNLTSTSVISVSMVVFAQIRAQSTRLAAAYTRAQSTVYAVVVPVMAVIVATGEPLVTLVFGPQWMASVLPAQALAIACVLTVGSALDRGLFHGLGRPGTWLGYAIVVDALTVAVTFVAAPYGLDAIAVCFIGVALVATLVRWPLVARHLGVPWQRLARPFVRAMLMGTCPTAAGLGVAMLTGEFPSLGAVATVGGVVGLTSLLAVALLMPDTAQDLRRLLTSTIHRFRGRTPVAEPALESGA